MVEDYRLLGEHEPGYFFDIVSDFDVEKELIVEQFKRLRKTSFAFGVSKDNFKLYLARWSHTDIKRQNDDIDYGGTIDIGMRADGKIDITLRGDASATFSNTPRDKETTLNLAGAMKKYFGEFFSSEIALFTRM